MPKMKADETLTAIAAAHAIWPTWAQMTAKERGAILRRYIRYLSNTEPDLHAAVPLLVYLQSGSCQLTLLIASATAG